MRSKEFKEHAEILERKIKDIESKHAADIAENKQLKEINKKSKEEIANLNNKLTNAIDTLESERAEYEKQKSQLIKSRDDTQRLADKLNEQISVLKQELTEVNRQQKINQEKYSKLAKKQKQQLSKEREDHNVELK